MTQKMIVMMPTLRRPELLALSLEKLSRTRQAASLDVRIHLDQCTDARLDEVEYVRDMYFPTASIYRAFTHILLPSGVWNILQSLKTGFLSGSDFIFFIEEDVFVTPDFFDRHLDMQASGDYFVTSGRKLPSKDEFYYSNPGSCYRREKLGLVVPHICDQYFADPKGYIEKHFPRMDDAGILDDGLIRRVMLSLGGQARCAVPPIAYHQGFHFYGKIKEYTVEGTIEEKIHQARTILANVDPNGRYTRDFEPYQES